MKKSNIFIGIIIILIIIFGILIFIPEEKETENLKIGIVIPLTGAVAPTGQDFLNGLLLSKEKINSNIEIYVEDSQSNAKDGVTAAKKLLDINNVDILVSLQSTVVVPLLEIADQYNKPLIATAISQDEFTQKSENAFRLFPPARQDAKLAAEFANENNFKDISIISIVDEYGISMKEHFKKNFNGNILHEESFKAEDKDFRTILLKTKDSEVVYFIGYIPHYIEYFKQREELGINNIVISNLVITSNLVRDELKELLDNAYATMPSLALINDKTKKFQEEYFKKYNKNPDWASPLGYDMALVLDAVQKNGKKPIEALHEIKVKGINSYISFDEEGEAYIALEIIKLEKGKILEND